jgi:heme A synthase
MNVGILGVIGVIFVTLKLLGKIDWDWWIVTSPFYGGFMLWLAILLIFGSTAWAFGKKARRKHRSF